MANRKTFQVLIIPSMDDEEAYENVTTFKAAKALSKSRKDSSSLHKFESEETREAFLKGYQAGCGFLGSGRGFKN